MRSRYTAYALNNLDYIMATTHPDSPHFRSTRDSWRRELESFSLTTRFAGLTILSVEPDIVTFRATLFELAAPNRDISFTERSLFRQVAGRWLYVDAIESPD
jgi:SEC-C motif-containing protein